MSRALITGVSGFAGSHLARRLVEDGWQVAGTCHTRESGLAGVSEHRLEITDATALGTLMRSFEPDVVFHLAAIVDTVRTPDEVRLHAVNILGTAAVISAHREEAPEAKLVHASSAFVYGASTPEAQPIDEKEPLRPVTPYGGSKVAAEALVNQYRRQTEAFTLVTRAFQHTGPGHVGAYAMADWARQVAEIGLGRREPVIACGDIEVERDYLDVRDVASAYIAAARDGQPGAVYNIASGVPRTMRSLLEGLIEHGGIEARIEQDPERLRPSDTPRFIGDAARLREQTGWRPAIPIEVTLADVVSFWRHRLSDA